MAIARLCPQCEIPLPAASPDWLCPRCLFGQAGGLLTADVPGIVPEITDVACSDVGVSRSFGDYELLSEIARGGIGVVYKARQISAPEDCSIKNAVVRPDPGQCIHEQIPRRSGG